MTQTLAIFLDAYRELNSRKLFWITLILSGVVVAAYGLIGINENGLRLMVWDVPFRVNTTVMSEETFYKIIFVNFGIGIWLAWAATILALVSTAGIFPDLITGGSIDLVLAKPISRMRLFLTKYCAGLLFVTLQVAVFSVASFLVIGMKGGAWEPGILLAVPIMVVFFSYLFSICVLLGLLTRSAIAALLLTLLVWFLIFAINSTESLVLRMKLAGEQKIANYERRIAAYERRLERLDQADDDTTAGRATTLQVRLERQREKLEEAGETQRKFDVAHNITFGVKTVLPKTSETIALLERWLIDLAELPGLSNKRDANVDLQIETGDFTLNGERLNRDALEIVRDRPVSWVIGTSIAFEVVLLALGGMIFCRRDF